MSFVPKNKGNSEGGSSGPTIDWEAINQAVTAGSRPARISMIVDMGEQELEDSVYDVDPSDARQTKAIEDGTGTVEKIDGEEKFVRQNNPVQELVIFADLVDDEVTYVEEDGKVPYRIMLNNTWQGEIKGFPFAVGNKLDNGNWTYGAKNVLTTLAQATDTQGILDGTDLDPSAMLGKPFMSLIVKKQNKEGTRTYVNYKGASPVPDLGGYVVPDLHVEPMLILFDEATKEQADMLRKGVKDKIKSALDYEGSQMQKAIEASEAGFKNRNDAPKVTPAQAAPKPAPEPEDDDSEDPPF